MSTTYTLAEVATRVLRDLNLVASDETPSATDMAWAEETTSGELAMLAATGIPIWAGSSVSLPIEYLTPVSRRVGLAVAPSFGLMDVATAQLAMREAERYLAVMAAPRPPLTLITNDAKPRLRRTFDFTTGQ